jgi:hypothetical protein
VVVRITDCGSPGYGQVSGGMGECSQPGQMVCPTKRAQMQGWKRVETSPEGWAVIDSYDYTSHCFPILACRGGSAHALTTSTPALLITNRRA